MISVEQPDSHCCLTRCNTTVTN